MTKAITVVIMPSSVFPQPENLRNYSTVHEMELVKCLSGSDLDISKCHLFRFQTITLHRAPPYRPGTKNFDVFSSARPAQKSMLVTLDIS
ncbi:hypothetical protein SK128_027764 [Halocaridina rubra]|uniref:Uncharacterized protein n=1 Tax=Halocaridina rubra TaxID=373956 RepID=A0AAN9A8S2_HALRR